MKTPDWATRVQHDIEVLGRANRHHEVTKARPIPQQGLVDVGDK
jgi:hypothetical protein